MSFPTSPIDGQVYNEYRYNISKLAWKKFNQPDIGYIYHQLPGKSDPTTLWGGTWLNVSSEFAGDFLRIEGGNAAAFDGTEQSDTLQGHGHQFYSAPVTSAGPGQSTWSITSAAPTQARNKDYVRAPITDGTNGTPRIDNETRPVNKTIRVWERIA